MSIMTLSRVSSSRPTLSPTSFSHAALSNRIKKKLATQTRTLWWWSRNGSWSSSNDEEFNDRMQKYQKILRYRYSRALRRRALWERENSLPLSAVRPPGRLMGRAWGSKPLSTTEQMQAKLKDEESGVPRYDSPWEEMQKDFETFKAAIDREIAKDPYHVLFGKRSRASPTARDSAWTAVSRFFVPPASKDGLDTTQQATRQAKRIKIENLEKQNSSRSQDRSSQPRSGGAENGNLRPTEDYVYDPISGRNIPRPMISSTEELQPQKPFLSTLFSEHENNSSDPAKPTHRQKAEGNVQKSRFETSKKHEYKTLRAATLGNTIDTTAEFGGRYKSETEIQDEAHVAKPVRPSPEPSDEEQPFVGTTYAARVEAQASDLATRTWLSKEGFTESNAGISSVATTRSCNQRQEPLQPSFDRLALASKNQERKFMSKLQPAIDRVEAVKPQANEHARSPPLNVVTKARPLTEQDLPLDMREDVDLLRASDIRAATKTTRITKQAAYQAKAKTRENLEHQFEKSEVDRVLETAITKPVRHGHASPPAPSLAGGSVDKATGKINQQTASMQSPKPGGESFKKYERHGRPSVELLERIDASEDALGSLRSIYEKSRKRGLLLNSLVADEATKNAQSASREITRELRAATQEMAEETRNQNVQLENLGHVIRQIYESETGPITTQTPQTEPIVQKPAKSPAMIKAPLLSVATVKPGVARYMQIERYTQEFEPKFASLVDQAKKVKATLHNVTNVLRDMQQKPTLLKEDGLSKRTTTDFGKGDRLQVMSTTKSGMIDEPPSSSTEQESTDLHPAPTEHTAAFDHRFVILTYNKQTGEVDTTCLENLFESSAATTEKANPIVVMGSLNYPAAFVSHFVKLEKSGYSLSNGGGDMLIFQKQPSTAEPSTSANEARSTLKSVESDLGGIRNRVAADEARNQPPPQLVASASSRIPFSAEIPSATQDTAPTATTSATESSAAPPQTKKKERKGPKVQRQERVFSGTLRPKKSLDAPDSGSVAGQPTNGSYVEPENTYAPPSPTGQLGIVRRFVRAVKRVILTTAALGGVAYAIGVVAEGMGAQAQQGRDASAGPRTKMIMPVTGQRADMASAANSRED